MDRVTVIEIHPKWRQPGNYAMKILYAAAAVHFMTITNHATVIHSIRYIQEAFESTAWAPAAYRKACGELDLVPLDTNAVQRVTRDDVVGRLSMRRLQQKLDHILRASQAAGSISSDEIQRIISLP